MPIITPKIPDGLPDLMRGLAKSIIKENPKNIYLHAAEYFENLLRERDGDLEKSKKFTAYRVLSDLKNRSAKSRDPPSCNCGKRVTACSQTSEIVENVASAGKKKKSAKKGQRPETVEAGSRVIAVAGLDDEMKLTENTHQFIFETPGDGHELKDVPSVAGQEKSMSKFNAVKPNLNTRAMSGGVKSELETLNPIDEATPDEMQGKAMHQAVVKIQAFYRGFMVRKEVVATKKKRAAIAGAAGGVVTAAAVGIVSALTDKGSKPSSAKSDKSVNSDSEMLDSATDDYGVVDDESEPSKSASSQVSNRNAANSAKSQTSEKSAPGSAKSVKSQASDKSDIEMAKNDSFVNEQDPNEETRFSKSTANSARSERSQTMIRSATGSANSVKSLSAKSVKSQASDKCHHTKAKTGKVNEFDEDSSEENGLAKSAVSSARSQSSYKSATSSARSVKSQGSFKNDERFERNDLSDDNIKDKTSAPNSAKSSKSQAMTRSAAGSANSNKSQILNRSATNSAKSVKSQSSINSDDGIAKSEEDQIEETELKRNENSAKTEKSGKIEERARNESVNDFDEETERNKLSEDHKNDTSAPKLAKSVEAQAMIRSVTNSANSVKSQASIKSDDENAKNEGDSIDETKSAKSAKSEKSQDFNRSLANSAKSVRSQTSVKSDAETRYEDDNEFEDDINEETDNVKSTGGSARSQKFEDLHKSNLGSANSQKSETLNKSTENSAKSVKSQDSNKNNESNDFDEDPNEINEFAKSAANSAKSDRSQTFIRSTASSAKSEKSHHSSNSLEENDKDDKSNNIQENPKIKTSAVTSASSQKSTTSNRSQANSANPQPTINREDTEDSKRTELDEITNKENLEHDIEDTGNDELKILEDEIITSANENVIKTADDIVGDVPESLLESTSMSNPNSNVDEAVDTKSKTSNQDKKDSKKKSFVKGLRKKAGVAVGTVAAGAIGVTAAVKSSLKSSNSFEKIPVIGKFNKKPGKALSMNNKAIKLSDAKATKAIVDAKDESQEATKSDTEDLKGNISELKESVESANNGNIIAIEQHSPEKQSLLEKINTKADEASENLSDTVNEISDDIKQVFYLNDGSEANDEKFDEKMEDGLESPKKQSFLDKLNAKANAASAALDNKMNDIGDSIKHALNKDIPDRDAQEAEINMEKEDTDDEKADEAAEILEKEGGKMNDSIQEALHLEKEVSENKDSDQSIEPKSSPEKLSFLSKMNAKADAAAEALEKEVHDLGDSIKHAFHLDDPESATDDTEKSNNSEDMIAENAEVFESPQKHSILEELNAKSNAAAVALEIETDAMGNNIKHTLYLDDAEKIKNEDGNVDDEQHKSPEKLSLIGRMNATANSASAALDKEISEIGNSIKNALHIDEPESEHKDKAKINTETGENSEKLSLLEKLNAKADDAAAAMNKEVGEVSDSIKHALHLDNIDSEKQNEEEQEELEKSITENRGGHESPQKLSFLGKLNAKADAAAAALEKEVSDMGDSIKHALHLDEPELEKQKDEEDLESPQKQSLIGKLNAKADASSSAMEKEVNEMGDSIKHALQLDEAELEKKDTKQEVHESSKKLSFLGKLNARADAASAALEKEVSEMGDSIKHALHLDDPALEKEKDQDVLESPQKQSLIGKLNAKADAASAALEKEVDEMGENIKHALHFDVADKNDNDDESSLKPGFDKISEITKEDTAEIHESPQKLSFLGKLNAKADAAAAALEKEAREMGDSIKHALHLDENEIENKQTKLEEHAVVQESPKKMSLLAKLNAKADSAAAALDKEVKEMGDSLKHTLHLDATNLENEDEKKLKEELESEEIHESPQKMSFLGKLNAKADAAAAALEKEVSEMGDSIKHTLHLDGADIEKQDEDKPKESEASEEILESPQKVSLLGKLNAKADAAAAALEKEVDEMGDSIKHALHLDGADLENQDEKKHNETEESGEVNESPKKMSFLGKLNTKADAAASALEKEVSEMGDSIKNALHLDGNDETEKQDEEKETGVRESPQKVSLLGKLNAKADAAAAALEKEIDEMGDSIKHALHLDGANIEHQDEEILNETEESGEVNESPQKMSFLGKLNAKADAAASALEKEVSEMGDSIKHALHLDGNDETEKQDEEEETGVHESPQKVSLLGKLNAKADAAAAALEKEVDEMGDSIKHALHLDGANIEHQDEEKLNETEESGEVNESPQKMSFLGKLNAKADAAASALEKEVSEMGDSIKHALHLDANDETEKQDEEKEAGVHESPQKVSLLGKLNANADSAAAALEKEVHEVSEEIKHALHLDGPGVQTEAENCNLDDDSDDVVIVSSTEISEPVVSPTFMEKLNAKADAASAALEAEVAEIGEAIKHTFHIGESETKNVEQSENQVIEELDSQINDSQTMSEIEAKDMATKVVEEVVETAEAIKNSLIPENQKEKSEDGINEEIATVLTATLSQREKFEAKIAAANSKRTNEDKNVTQIEERDDINERIDDLEHAKEGNLLENVTNNLSFREQFEAKIAKVNTPEPQRIDSGAAEETRGTTEDLEQKKEGVANPKTPEPQLMNSGETKETIETANEKPDGELEIIQQRTDTLSQREKFEAKIAAAKLETPKLLPQQRTLSQNSSDIEETESGSHNPHSISNQTTVDIAGVDDREPLLPKDQTSVDSVEPNDIEEQNETSPPHSAETKKSRKKRSILKSPPLEQSDSVEHTSSDTSFLKKLDKKAAAVIAGGAAALGTVFAIKGTSNEKTPSDEDNEGVDTIDQRKSAKSGSGRLRSRIPIKTQKSKEMEIKVAVETTSPLKSPKETIQPSAPQLSEIEEHKNEPAEEKTKETDGTMSSTKESEKMDSQSIKDYQGDEPFVNMNGKLLTQISNEFSDDFSEESKPTQQDEAENDDEAKDEAEQDEEDNEDDNDSGEEELIRRFTRLRKTSITETDEETGEITQTRIEEYEEYSMVWEANDDDQVSVEEPTCISRSVSATTIISNDNDSDQTMGTPDLAQKSDIIEEEGGTKPPTPETTKRIKTELAEIEHFEAEANKDSIEAMFYNLKKKELEHDLKMTAAEKKAQNLIKQATEDDDDVVFVHADEEEATDSFNPMEQAMRRNKQLLEQMHGQGADNGAEDEDEFDEFQPGNIRKKILASSADSDYFDPTDPAAQINENNIKTALETITSTDSESSTIVSAATKIQAGARGYLARKQVQSIRSSSSAQPTQESFGNAAINQSLDDMIEQQQKQNLLMEQEAAVRIQRTYRNFLNTRRVEFSQQRAFTEDLSNHSYDDRTGGPIIEVKVEKRGKLASGDRRSVDSVDSIQYEPLEETDSELKRKSKFFQSLNVDVYNTATRRQTFHRGDAVYNNSTPENDSGKSNAESTEMVQKPVTVDPTPTDEPKLEQVVATTSTSTQPTTTSVATTTEARKRKNRLTFGLRQRSMPVQIETTIIRVLPKHLRKRIKSADGEAKKRRYITSSFEHFF